MYTRILITFKTIDTHSCKPDLLEVGNLNLFEVHLGATPSLPHGSFATGHSISPQITILTLVDLSWQIQFIQGLAPMGLGGDEN